MRIDDERRTLGDQSSIKETFYVETTLGQTLGIGSYDHLLQSNLYSQPVDFRRFTSPTGTLYSMRFPETPLYGARLLQLLSSVAPLPLKLYDISSFGKSARTTMTKHAILSDWEIVESDRKRDLELMQQHEALKEPWEQFVTYHARPFINALRAVTEGEINDYIDSRRELFITKDEATRDLSGALKRASRGQHRFYRYTVGDHLGSNLPIINEDLEKKGLGAVPINQLIYASSIHKLIAMLDPETINRLIPNSRLSIFGAERVPVSPEFDQGKIYAGMQAEPDSDYYVEHQGSGQIVIYAKDSRATYQINGENIDEVERILQDGRKDAIYPFIVWSKSHDGKRTYIVNPNLVPDGIRQPQDNEIAGLLTVTHLSPELQQQLPKRVGFPRDKQKPRRHNIKQDMMEAQVPLLVSMFRKMIVQSPVFDSFEGYAMRAN